MRFLTSARALASSLAVMGALTVSAVTPAVNNAAPSRPAPSHLVQLYTRPQVLKWMDTVTLSGACPDGGYVVQDPTNYLAVPYVPRASATNLFYTLVDGGSGAGSVSVSVNNGVQAQEIAAFEYTCRVPGAAPADAPPLATLMPRRAHF